jgi:uncharacterized membrane protein YheB (UPF0754 family)
MEYVLTLLLMMIIGAMIGGFTNYLAIRMLFRPYRTLFVGKWRIPFTPGLIPKRKDELAEQLGHLVNTHLVTAEVVSGKLFDPAFKQEVLVYLERRVDQWLSQKRTLHDVLEKVWGGHTEGESLFYLLDEPIHRLGEEGLCRLGPLSLSQVLPPELLKKIDQEIITALSPYLLERIVRFINGDEGERELTKLLDKLLYQRQGWFRLFSIFREERLVQIVQHELVQLLSHPLTLEALDALIRKEWERVKTVPLETLWKTFGKEPFLQPVGGALKRVWLDLLHHPLDALIGDHGRQMIDQGLVRALDQLEAWIRPRVGMMLDQLELERLVADRVKSFPLEKVEALAVSIAKRELYMITYLGAGLGGAIGLIQGLIVLFLDKF